MKKQFKYLSNKKQYKLIKHNLKNHLEQYDGDEWLDSLGDLEQDGYYRVSRNYSGLFRAFLQLLLFALICFLAYNFICIGKKMMKNEMVEKNIMYKVGHTYHYYPMFIGAGEEE